MAVALAGCATAPPAAQTARQPAPLRSEWAAGADSPEVSVGAEAEPESRAETVLSGMAFNPSASGGTGEADAREPSTSLAAPERPIAQLEGAGFFPDEDQALVGLDWVGALDQPELTKAVTRALQHNFDLQARAARVASAVSAVRSSAAQRYPQLRGTGGASRRRTNFDASNPGIPGGGDSVVSQTSSQFTLQAEVSWELDVWRRLEDLQQADLASAQASLADFYGARLSLAGRTAQAWIEVAATSLQLALAEDTESSFRTTLGLIERRYERGVSSSLDLRLARAQTESAAAQVYARANQLQSQRRQLAVLQGKYPETKLQRVELPALGDVVPTGLPSDLLTRRPDLIAAERRLAAQDERISAARKAFLPSFSLTAGAGQSSEELGELLDGSWSVWSLAANLIQPIFQGGQLTANLRRQQAQAVEALANYGSTALTAFQEVETALAAEELLRQRVERLALAAEESVAAVDLAINQYQRGLTDIITVLESQRRSFNDQSALIEGRASLLRNRIDLHLALGGGFDADAAELIVPLPFQEQVTGLTGAASRDRLTVDRGFEP
ncbi:MAG: efflux transporter outer membrane subunit [Opitutales bacterium]